MLTACVLLSMGVIGCWVATFAMMCFWKLINRLNRTAQSVFEEIQLSILRLICALGWYAAIGLMFYFISIMKKGVAQMI